ncbi:MAG: DUF4923 family protein [Bacteroidales bacterium]|nr:DUF4923 family protein [Bacteroidales bacterium]
MKSITTIVTIMSLLMISGTISAQSLKDILKSSAVKDAISSVTGINIPSDVTGQWNYCGSAVKFESDDILKNTAATLAAGEVEKKLNTYIEKIGLKEGTFSYEFKADSTFAATFKGKPVTGTYSVSPDGKSIEMKYGKSLNMMKMKAALSVNANDMDLLFNADKLLEFIGKISASSSNTTLKSLSSIASGYDGMKIGFQVKRKE